MSREMIFTSESVSEGHPDKVCDLISDSILDACLAQDPRSRVACESFATTDNVVIGGEITTNAVVDYEKIVRDTVREIGYDRENEGFCCDTLKVTNLIHTQSGDIDMGVSTGGAGDQGMMFGYACDENESFMPSPVMWSHRILQKAAEIRKSGNAPFLRPDSKCQLSFRYVDGRPVDIDTVVVSHQHTADISQKELSEYLIENVVKPVLDGTGYLTDRTRYLVNPTGRFVIGGPNGDTGLTGRKIIVDTYGGMARHGGGAFSGKDPSKVDRSACYMARHVAKNLVMAGLCSRCELQIAYAIGVAEPVSVMVETYGTEKTDIREIEDIVRRSFDLTPGGIISHLDLLRPIYRETTNYGHFGKDSLPWEKKVSLR